MTVETLQTEHFPECNSQCDGDTHYLEGEPFPPPVGYSYEALAEALIHVDLEANGPLLRQHPDHWRWMAERVFQYEGWDEAIEPRLGSDS